MRKLAAIFPRVLAALAALASSACFDIREELHIHRDGSGRAALDYTVPASALRLAGGKAGVEEKVRALIASQPKLRLDAVTVEEAGPDEARIALRISTDSMLALLDMKESEAFRQLPSAAGKLAGDIDVRPRGLDLHFARTVDVGDALGLAALAIGREERAKRKLTYIVHLPRAASESNATAVADQGRTLIWEATLGEALRRPLVTRFRAPLPIPWYAHAGTLAVIAGLVGWGLRAIRRRRRRRAEAGPGAWEKSPAGDGRFSHGGSGNRAVGHGEDPD